MEIKLKNKVLNNNSIGGIQQEDLVMSQMNYDKGYYP